MLEKLSHTFQQALTTHQQEDAETYYWFRTSDQELFGLKKEALSDENYVLMQQLFEEVVADPSHFTSKEHRRWYRYLYEDAKLPSSWHGKSIRLYYLFTQDNLIEDHFLETILEENFPQLTVMKQSASCFVLIDLDLSLESCEVETFIRAFIADALVPIQRFSGQQHLVDHELKEKIVTELMTFQQHVATQKRDELLSFADVFPFSHKKQKEMLSTPLLTALQDSETTQMIQILCACNLNSSLAAKKLFIHRNSLQYRLERFLQQTGLDLRTFSHAMFALIALKL